MTNSHLLFGRMVGYGGIPQYPQVDLCHMLDVKRPDLTSDRFPIQGRSPLEGRHCCMTSVDSDSNSTSLLQKWWVSQKKLGFLLSFRKSLPYDPTVLLLEKKSPQRCSPRLFLSWGEKLPIPKRCICNRWTWLMTVTLKPGVFSCFLISAKALYGADHFSERLWGWRIYDELEVKTWGSWEKLLKWEVRIRKYRVLRWNDFVLNTAVVYIYMMLEKIKVCTTR